MTVPRPSRGRTRRSGRLGLLAACSLALAAAALAWGWWRSGQRTDFLRFRPGLVVVSGEGRVEISWNRRLPLRSAWDAASLAHPAAAARTGGFDAWFSKSSVGASAPHWALIAAAGAAGGAVLIARRP